MPPIRAYRAWCTGSTSANSPSARTGGWGSSDSSPAMALEDLAVGTLGLGLQPFFLAPVSLPSGCIAGKAVAGNNQLQHPNQPVFVGQVFDLLRLFGDHVRRVRKLVRPVHRAALSDVTILPPPGQWRMPNPSNSPVGASLVTSTPSTRALGGPRLAHAISRSTAAASPSATISTSPVGR